MEEILAIAERHAREHRASQIHRVTLRVGILSGVVPDALRFAFDALRGGTMAEGATLEIEEPPVVCWCSQCNHSFEHPGVSYACPQCSRTTADVRGGLEFEVASLEVS